MIIGLTRKWDWPSNSLSLLSPEVRDYAVRVSVFSFAGNACGERPHSAYLSRLHSCEALGLWGSAGNTVLVWALNPIPPHSGHPVIQGPPPGMDFFLYAQLPGIPRRKRKSISPTVVAVRSVEMGVQVTKCFCSLFDTSLWLWGLLTPIEGSLRAGNHGTPVWIWTKNKLVWLLLWQKLGFGSGASLITVILAKPLGCGVINALNSDQLRQGCVSWCSWKDVGQQIAYSSQGCTLASRHQCWQDSSLPIHSLAPLAYFFFNIFVCLSVLISVATGRIF